MHSWRPKRGIYGGGVMLAKETELAAPQTPRKCNLKESLQ
jgi:hypothetical protein